MSQSKSDLIALVAEQTGNTKTDVKTILDAAFDYIKRITVKESLAIHDFGVFKIKDRAARTGRNPSTGEQIQIPASSVLSFKATKHKG
jgi:DNA-binding protein HU-beta